MQQTYESPLLVRSLTHIPKIFPKISSKEAWNSPTSPCGMQMWPKLDTANKHPLLPPTPAAFLFVSPSCHSIVPCDWMFVWWWGTGSWHLQKADFSSYTPAAFGSDCLASEYPVCGTSVVVQKCVNISASVCAKQVLSRVLHYAPSPGMDLMGHEEQAGEANPEAA